MHEPQAIQHGCDKRCCFLTDVHWDDRSDNIPHIYAPDYPLMLGVRVIVTVGVGVIVVVGVGVNDLVGVTVGVGSGVVLLKGFSVGAGQQLILIIVIIVSCFY